MNGRRLVTSGTGVTKRPIADCLYGTAPSAFSGRRRSAYAPRDLARAFWIAGRRVDSRPGPSGLRRVPTESEPAQSAPRSDVSESPALRGPPPITPGLAPTYLVPLYFP